jgi:hypothetical protein
MPITETYHYRIKIGDIQIVAKDKENICEKKLERLVNKYKSY